MKNKSVIAFLRFENVFFAACLLCLGSLAQAEELADVPVQDSPQASVEPISPKQATPKIEREIPLQRELSVEDYQWLGQVVC